MSGRRAGRGHTARWVGWALVAIVASVIAAGFANRLAKQHLQGLVGRKAALVLDLFFNVTLERSDAGMCLVVGDSRSVPFGTWATRCRVANVAQYGSSTFFWRDMRHPVSFMLPEPADVAVWLGVNDLRHDLHTDGSVSAANLIELIEALATPRRRVWVLPQIPVLLEDLEARARFERAGRAIESELRARFSKDPRVRFVDLSAVVGTFERPVPSAYADPVHLTRKATLRVRALLDRAWRRGPGAQ